MRSGAESRALHASARSVLFATLLASAFATGCVLDDFKKVGGVCSLPASVSAPCAACIRATACCALAETCAHDARCSADFGKPVTPSAVFSDSYEPLLGCLQERCDEACQISWGCLDGYTHAPAPRVDNTLTLFDSSTEYGVPGLSVSACAGTDPLCLDGSPLGQTDASGAISLAPAQDGLDFLALRHAPGEPDNPDLYVPTRTRWSEPVQRYGPLTSYVFAQKQVEALVTVTAGASAYDARGSHLVFFAHNCLPMRYAFRGYAPFVQAEDVVIELEPMPEGTRIIYTSADAQPSPALRMTSRVGSGGVSNIPSDRNLTLTATRSGRRYAQTTLSAPVGGLAIVHLIPAPSR